jgi:hypothetical protein
MKRISEKKQALINEKKSQHLEVGDDVYVFYPALHSYASEKDKQRTVLSKISSIDGDNIKVYKEGREYSITKKDIKEVDIRYIGANPFIEKGGDVRFVAFTLESIIHNLALIESRSETNYCIGDTEVKETNWNPYVYDKDGNKMYYQRPLVWILEDKQNLIESIYNGIDCGKVLVRLRSWSWLEEQEKKGEKELFFKDIVDGKQRMHTIKEFLEDKFQDLHGNFFSDLSAYAQYKLTNNQLISYAEMGEKTTDEEVIYQFLKMNFSGVPQSKEHIEFVKSIATKI